MRIKLNKLRRVRNSVSDDFESNYKPSERVLIYNDQVLVVNERKNSCNKRMELNARLKCKIIILAIRRFLIDENIL